jgi:hypothetical protein
MRINAGPRRRRNILTLAISIEVEASGRRGYHGGTAPLHLRRKIFVGAQPAFLTQNLHQPFGLISPSTNVQAFGS